jgi:hypothetical protein
MGCRALPASRNPLCGFCGAQIHAACFDFSDAVARPAEDPAAALADKAAAAAPLAGMLDGRSPPSIVNGQALSELHLHSLWSVGCQERGDIIDIALRPRRGIA